jgi:AraC-like DNA-binding protein
MPKGKGRGRTPIPVRPLSVGIPEKEIILDQVLYWIDLQATAQEIAGSFHVSVDTLDRRIKDHFGMNFAELYKRTAGQAKITLRRWQFQMAEKNCTMAIFLGKQWLGQTDHQDKQEAPKQEDVDLKDKYYASKYENQQLRKELDDLKSKASQELQRSDPPI